MASFDENGKYIKTNWKAGDKITATKLNKIEESIEAVNDNDISRHVEADTRLDALEAKDVAHDKELTNIKNTIADNKAAAELGDYDINSRMQFLEDELEEAVAEVNNVASTVDGKIAQAEADMEAMVDNVESEMIELQNDMTNAQTQTFAVTDTYKFTVDHDGMMPSLVTLDNIEGQSEIVSNNEGSKYLRTTNIKSICTIDTSKNYLDDATYEDRRTTHSIDGYNINVVGEPGWSYVVVHIYNLEIGNKYCITLDAEVTSGNSALEIVSGFQTDYTIEQCVNSRAPRKSANSVIGVYDGGEAIIRLHASLDTTAGNVTYKNIQINKVKEMIVPDIRLNSLPNGVKDEIKDGMLIKRTKHVNLADLTWVPSGTNAQFPESEFVVYHSHSTSDLIVDPNAWEDELGEILCNNIPSVPIMATWSADPSEATNNRVGISGHTEHADLRIKLYRSDVPDLSSLNAWLTANNVYAVYELETPECIPVNLTIKADKGDTVVINTTKIMDLTYSIQLNTGAQIDSIQDLVGGYLEHGPYLPLSGGTITGDLSANCFESIKTVESTDGRGTIGSITKTQVFTDQYGQGRFIIENNSTDTPLVFIANPHDRSYSVNGDFTPAGGTSLKLGSDMNRWSSLYCNAANFGDKKAISNNNGMLYITASNMEFFFQNDSSSAVPCFRPQGSNIHLGHTSHRWNTLYLVNNPNVSSDRVMKENIEYIGKSKSELTYEDMYDFIKDDLGLATYNFIGDDKLRMNFIAQDLLVNADGTDSKVGQMIVNPVPVPTEEEIAEGKPYPTLSYDMGMYISVLAGALKESINKIEQLEARINELENK